MATPDRPGAKGAEGYESDTRPDICSVVDKTYGFARQYDSRLHTENDSGDLGYESNITNVEKEEGNTGKPLLPDNFYLSIRRDQNIIDEDSGRSDDAIIFLQC